MKLIHAKNRPGFTLVELLVVIAIIAVLAAILSPIIIGQINKSRATGAINNAKDIHIGLRDYCINRGALPLADSTTNEDLVPVFSKGYIKDEKPFWVKGVSGYVEPDGKLGSSFEMFFRGRNMCLLILPNHKRNNGMNLTSERQQCLLAARKTAGVIGGVYGGDTTVAFQSGLWRPRCDPQGGWISGSISNRCYNWPHP